jgi:UDP-N-acetylmuramoylalanine--D-glutamate ligase
METSVHERSTLRRLLETGTGRVLVLGGGKSGRAASDRLRARGVTCIIADRSGADGGEGWITDGEPSALDGVDLVVKSPGVRRDHSLVAEAGRRGVPIVGELELGWALSVAPLYVITGSNGKSTVTSLLAHVFANAGLPSAAAGNIGEPLSEIGPSIEATGAIAVEASSFQIEDLVDFRCRGAAVLNVSPDHLDRHGTLERYLEIKLRLLDHVEPGGWRVIGADDPLLRDAARDSVVAEPERTVRFGLAPGDGPGAYLDGDDLVWVHGGERRRVASRAELVLDGPHNVANALAAICLAKAAGIEDAAIATAFRTFRPLAHRLERVGRAGEVLFVNDSKATNLDAMCMAIRSFDVPIVLIAGGRDKATPFEEAHDLARERLLHVVLIGEAAARLREAWPDVPATGAASMEEAVRAAFARIGPRGVVLLAPGCASFDMFTNFEARGEAFRAAARAIIGEGV